MPHPGSRHVRSFTVSRLALRLEPFEPCFMLVAPLGFNPSERFLLEEPYTSRCRMPSCRCLSNRKLLFSGNGGSRCLSVPRDVLPGHASCRCWPKWAGLTMRQSARIPRATILLLVRMNTYSVGPLPRMWALVRAPCIANVMVGSWLRCIRGVHAGLVAARPLGRLVSSPLCPPGHEEPGPLHHDVVFRFWLAAPAKTRRT